MKEMSYQEMIKVQLNLLDIFHKFCVNNNLHYSLNYGTLIGAIRHKGLIPWDDDVDVAMPREDFNKLFELYDNNSNPKYKVLNHHIRPEIDTKIGYMIDFDTLITTVMDKNTKEWKCLHIDIYPIDIMPKGYWESKIFYFRTRFLNKLIYLRTLRIKVPKGSRSTTKQIAVIIFRILLCWLDYNKALNRLIKLAQTYKKPLSDLKDDDMASILCEFDRPMIFPARIFAEYTTAEFNGKRYNVIKEFDKYLRLWYGNYMQLPPEKDRHPKRDSFTKYLWK